MIPFAKIIHFFQKHTIFPFFLYICMPAHEMSRTMLRYAIEKMSDEERKEWMSIPQDQDSRQTTSGSQRYRFISTCPLLLKVTPSSSNNVRWRLHPGAVRPSLFTTR